MKRILFVATIISIFSFQFSISHAQRVVEDNWSRLTVEFNADQVTVGKTVLCGETFSTLSLEGYQQPLANYGSPALPTFSQLIEVPLGAEFEVTVSNAVYDTLPALQHRLVPVQLPRSKSDTSAMKLCLNWQAYSWNAFVGQPKASVEAVGIARDRRLARLQYSPVRYNPVTGQVIVCRHASVTVTYRGADQAASLEMFERYYSPAFNSGANPLNSLYPKAVRTTAPVRMLIVANSMFRNHLDSFVQWKQRKGFRTDIVYTNDPGVGSDTASISAYIKSQYTNATTANPAPTYVLLVGDVAQLPAFNAHNSSPSSDHVTDLYYMTWTTGDHLPDCHYGRFSAQTVAQLTPQVQKTLMYEQYTFSDPTFLDRAVMVAGVDGGTAGDYGYTHADPTMDYAITNYVNGTHGWSQVMYFKNDVSIIPACTTNVTIGSSASSNSATVRSYYNQGAGFINYTAHGGSTGWGTPNFGNTHVNSMTNYEKFGLMIGNCCLTNKFEESTCFGEALLRKGEYCGAVGYIGGSNSTYWGQDVYWAMGVRSSISASMSMAYDASHLGVYDRTFHTHGEAYSQWCTTQGSMIMQGNMAVESSSSSTGMKWYYWEIYHLMGDPSVMPYMTQASVMPVSVASVVNYGASMLSVSAVPNAYVALTDTVTGALVAAAYADASGNASLILPSDLPVSTYLLAASAQQYRTAFRCISVIQPSGPFPMVSDITSAALNAGDSVALTVHVENLGNAIARNITVQLSSSNPTVTLNGSSSTTLTIDSLAAGASLNLTAAVNAFVAENAVDNSFVDITTTSSWTGVTTPAVSTLRRWINAPVLSITFSPANPSLTHGTATTVTATLQNTGHAATKPHTLVFSSPTSLLSLTANTTTQSLSPSASQTFTLTLQADSQLPENIYVPVAYSFGTLTGELPVFIGTNFMETFEGGTIHLSGWSSPTTYPWFTTNDQAYQGTYSLRSAYMGASQTSNMNITVSSNIADTVSFYYRVSSENNYDKFFFLIDGTEQFNASGEVDWTRAAYPLSAGSHTLTFRYSKDGSVNNGSDCAWIDNVVIPHVVHPATFLNDTLCAGENYTVNGTAVNTDTPGSYSWQGTASNGSSLLVDYTVLPSPLIEESASACDSYLWHGTLYTASGDITEARTNPLGCDSTFVLHLTILPTSHSEETVTACDSYIHNGVVHTESYAETDTLVSALGCDSIIGFSLVINHSAFDTLTVSTLANDYTWNDSVYTLSGTYQQVFLTTEGCDSTVTLILTIGNSSQAITQSDIQTFSIYPNPTNGWLQFSQKVEKVTVYDLTGRVVREVRQVDAIDLGNLVPGVYTLHLTDSGATSIQRVVKE